MRKLIVAFLLSANGTAYWAAQSLGIVEFIVERSFFPDWGRHLYRTAFFLGLAMVVAGQIIRSTAMIQAAQSFSHSLAYSKKDNHVLVTSGIYS